VNYADEICIDEMICLELKIEFLQKAALEKFFCCGMRGFGNEEIMEAQGCFLDGF
jgi:hypothetical protein